MALFEFGRPVDGAGRARGFGGRERALRLAVAQEEAFDRDLIVAHAFAAHPALVEAVRGMLRDSRARWEDEVAVEDFGAIGERPGHGFEFANDGMVEAMRAVRASAPGEVE